MLHWSLRHRAPLTRPRPVSGRRAYRGEISGQTAGDDEIGDDAVGRDAKPPEVRRDFPAQRSAVLRADAAQGPHRAAPTRGKREKSERERRFRVYEEAPGFRPGPRTDEGGDTDDEVHLEQTVSIRVTRYDLVILSTR